MPRPEYIGTNDFKITMPIAKSFMKSDENGNHMLIAGVASSTDLDLDGERMATSAVDAFKKAVDEGMLLPNGKWSMVPLRTEHQKGWHDNLGWITKAEVDDQYNLWIEAELDETSSTAKDLFAKLNRGDRPGKPLQLGFSVGGSIKKASREWDANIGRSVRVIEDVVLKEISVVSQPANPTTYVEALTKSVNWDEVPLSQEEVVKELSMSDNKNRTTELVKAEVNNTEVDKTETALEVEASDQNKVSEEVTKKEEDVEVEVVLEKETQAEESTQTEKTAEGENILDLFKELKTQVDELRQLMSDSVKSTKEEVVEKEVVVEKSDEISLEDRISTALNTVLSTFTKDHLEPLSSEVQAMKAVVEEISTQPIDKSLSVTSAKEGEEALEKFHNRVKGDKYGSIIGAAVRVATGTE